MGKYRSRSGCLTCRARRVKCDETHPICLACSKKNRPCQWETLQTKFKSYQPDAASNKSAESRDRSEGLTDDMDVDEAEEDLMGRNISPRDFQQRQNLKTRRGAPSASISSVSARSSPQFVTSALQPPSVGRSSDQNLAQSQALDRSLEGSTFPLPLSHDEAFLVHHYTEHLGRWLDCTDASRQFTLGVPEKVRSCPVLCQAVLCFAARHRKNVATAEVAYQHCIALLIERLNESAASRDETLLCAIVILRFYEQLNVPSSTGSDDEQHLAGCSAILRASQGNHFVDPSAPSLREAAFWVYVRQCLYNATINQQPPDVDFSLQLHPAPNSLQDSHPLARLRLETAWANQMTWHTACVVNFCFDGFDGQSERSRRWEELWDDVQTWVNQRPKGFDPVWQGQAGETGVFPEVWFTADWHVVSFGFYHFACIMLLSYKPGPKFALRTVGRLTENDSLILGHARALCGACKSAPETVPLLITLCHTIFIWGPLISDLHEQEEIFGLLENLERGHLWPTTWIINALRNVWGLN